MHDARHVCVPGDGDDGAAGPVLGQEERRGAGRGQADDGRGVVHEGSVDRRDRDGRGRVCGRRRGVPGEVMESHEREIIASEVTGWICMETTAGH